MHEGMWFRLGLLLACAGLACPVLAAAAKESDFEKSLAGTWRFRLDPQDVGVHQSWFVAELPGSIRLPGSTAQAGFGEDVSVDTKWTGDIVDRSWFTEERYEKYRRSGQVKVPFWLTPVKWYVGPAWYQTDLTVPEAWRGRHIVLTLERCHWVTRVWVDGRAVAGDGESLAVPHEYDLGKSLSPGKHTLCVRVDNTVRVNVGPNAHSVSDHTQSNWNGIVGKISLKAISPVHIQDVQVYPDVAGGKAKVVVRVANTTGSPASGTLSIRAECTQPPGKHAAPRMEVPFKADEAETTHELEYKLGAGFLTWDEFDPNVYTMTVELKTGELADAKSVEFGMRELGTDGTQFTINGRKTFIRGTLECCIFPETGYPPTDVESWMRILRIARAHGLNQLRFHSWCPPEAAFVAGDRMGFMYQVECCVWTKVGEDATTDGWIRAESERILRTYGNHPSLCFLNHGNEPSGKNQNRFLGDLVEHWKKTDSRRLYTSASGWPLIPENQYHVTPDPRIQRWGQGLRSRINAQPPETETDYRDFVAKYEVPVVAHEIGQWCVYPDFGEIDRYTGVLRARNFEIFRDGLQEAGMADQARDFLMASGKLQTLCYKEDIESALRTPGFGGFQLLDLHDFPGQGTALVGVLNPFWDSKGYVTPEEYHRFCCETVPLARVKKRVWTSAETFEAGIEVAHFGPAPIKKARVTWSLKDSEKDTIGLDQFPEKTIDIGNRRRLGVVSLPLKGVRRATKAVLTVSIRGTDYANDWDIWIYPPEVDTGVPDGIVVTHELNAAAEEVLRDGGKVLFLPPPNSVAGDAHGVVPPGFSSIFWNTAWTRGQAPHTLGILCDPNHPLFKEFPTESHSNWQWWDLIHDSQIMILSECPRDLRPLVQVIDDWVTNRKLGLLFEARVGAGKLVVCGIDIEKDLESRPVARQFRRSLLSYMAGRRFTPLVQVRADVVRKMFGRLGIEVVKVDSEADNLGAAQALDGDPRSIWHTAFGTGAPRYPHELTLKIARSTRLKGIRYLPRQDQDHGWISRYEVYVSTDGQEWGTPVAEGSFKKGPEEKRILFEKPVEARYIRFVAREGFDKQPWASIAEVVMIPE